MSELKDLAWQAQSQSPAPELETLVKRSRTRLRRRRALAIAASLVAIAVPAVVVINQATDAAPDPAATEVRPRTGRELAHSADAELTKFYPLPGGNWVASWIRCRQPAPDQPTVCWSTLASKSAAGIEFTEPVDDYPYLELYGDLVYGSRNVQYDPAKPRLTTIENGRPVERPLTVSGTTSTIGNGLLLRTSGPLLVVDQRTGQGRVLQLPADLRNPHRFFRDQSGRWWLAKSGLLAWTADGGRTWTRQPTSGKYVEVGISPDGRTIMLQEQVSEAEGPGEYLRSRDGGRTWTTIPDPDKRVLGIEAVFDDGTGLVTDKTLRATVMTSLLRIAPDGTIGTELQTPYSLSSIEALGDQVIGLVEGPAITSPSPVPTTTPTPLPPPKQPVHEVAISNNRGADWQVFDPR
ncbi:WD40/YVTN/BNR-like repeat-containing protein [Kribbella sp. CA-294648]|uniref:WD40/YVTN/BNR-like repeat-containing protein n=1 Tax=Kribbella sp. CA-294648 TaxID=3239948 RepID=UPI003D8B217F